MDSPLLSLPIVDFVEKPTSELRSLFRQEHLLEDDEMEVIEHIIQLKIIRLFLQQADVEALHEECDALRRLIPHAKRNAYNNKEVYSRSWAERVNAYADLIGLVAETKRSRREPKKAQRFPGAKKLLKLVQESPGISEDDALKYLECSQIHGRRLFAVLEANGLLSRRVHGKKHERTLHPIK